MTLTEAQIHTDAAPRKDQLVDATLLAETLADIFADQDLPEDFASRLPTDPSFDTPAQHAAGEWHLLYRLKNDLPEGVYSQFRARAAREVLATTESLGISPDDLQSQAEELLVQRTRNNFRGFIPRTHS